MNAPLKVPRAAVTVTLLVDGGDPVQAALFVPPGHDEAPCLAVHALLEGESAFLPALQPGVAGALLINKDRIRWVSVPRNEGSASLDELFDVYQAVEVITAADGGEPLAGDLLFSAPRERRRVGDFLNQQERFLCLHQQDRALLINKRYLVSVKELPCPR